MINANQALSNSALKMTTVSKMFVGFAINILTVLPLVYFKILVFYYEYLFKNCTILDLQQKCKSNFLLPFSVVRAWHYM